MDVIRWFPLDRLAELEAAIGADLASVRLTERRDALAVALGLHGLRVGEVRRAGVADLVQSSGFLHVPPFKRGYGRNIPLDRSVVNALVAYLRERRVDSSQLLCTRTGRPVCHKRFQRAAGRMFVRVLGESTDGLTFHSLRHTFAMRTYQRTKDLDLVKRLLGHRSITSTEVYARSLSELPADCLVKVAGGFSGRREAVRLMRPVRSTRLRVFRG